MPRIDEAVVSAGPGESRIALLSEGSVVEFIVDRGDPAPGDVIEGRVVEIAKALDAAFVDIGAAAPAILNGHAGLAVGQPVLVEIAAAARAEKGPKVKLRESGAKPLRRSPLARALADHPSIGRVVVDDMAALADAKAIFPDARHAAGAFADSGAEAALDQALGRRVELTGGGALTFAETEAATLIDIDSGGGEPAKANIAAAIEIARQLRLRAIGGQVLIDAIPAKGARGAARFQAALAEAVADDPAQVRIFGRGPLGMMELRRARRGPSLAELMLSPVRDAPSPAAAGLAALRTLLREAMARPGAALRIEVAPRVAGALYRRPAALAETSRRLGRKLDIVERADLETFTIAEAPR